MIDNARHSLEGMLRQTPYAGYAYSYPHKTAYRPLTPPVPLREIWEPDQRDALFLYLHVPFCEMRCGFCNLFTTAHPREGFATRYLQTLRREAEVVREAVGPARIRRMAVGGGTPTYLDEADLTALLDIARDVFGADLPAIPVSVETSPRTAEPGKLRVLRERGVDRVSIGVQSFVEAETAAIGRAQKTALVERALGAIRAAGIPTLNVDLMYGLPGQTEDTWLHSLRSALRFTPEEIYLYPLYVRPLTGLGKSGREWDDQRLALYRRGREFLLGAGYAQLSMRMFRRGDAPPLPQEGGPVYCCQEDGMIGLGCGARSYTSTLHYSSEYAVGRAGVRGILDAYVETPEADFAAARYGASVDASERRRRYAIKSLLRAEGLEYAAYRRHFGTDAREDLPELPDLARLDLATEEDGWLRLTPAGMERSDAIGPWLYSDAVRASMEGFELR